MTRKNTFKTLVVIALSGSFAALAAPANVDLKPGKYTVTITYEVQGQRQNQSRTSTRCITAKDLGNPEKIFNDQAVSTLKEKDVCSVRDLKSTGGKISYDVDCLNRSVHVQGNVSATGFSALRTVTPKASRSVTLKFTVRGTRTGDCGAGVR
ncbi:MAG TPA: DUF3617 family protein [Candidatus Acidoferrales bacterium]|nr:DUF3617 family protein [Candidatus Acidoferrales bacterium]